MSVSSINYVQIKNCIVDDIHIRENKDGTLLTPTYKDWQFDTYLLAKFNDLEAGSVGLSGLTIDKWKIKRRKIDSLQFVEIGTTPNVNGNITYNDYTPRCNVTYEYEVVPMAGEIEGQPKTIQILCELEYWWLSDENESYPFYANFQSSDIAKNIQRQVYEGFDQYPTVSYSPLKYATGSITAMLIDAYGQTSYNYKNRVEEFINNRKPKYLRNVYGDIWLVDTHSSRMTYDTTVVEDNYTITFDFMEIGKVNE